MTATTMRAKSLQADLQAKRAEIEGIASEFTEEQPGKYSISPEKHETYLKSIADLERIQSELQAEQKAAAIFEWMDNPTGTSAAGADAAQAAQAVQFKSLGESILESDEYKAMAEGNFQRLGQVFSYKRSLFDGEAKDLYSASGGTIPTPGFGRAQNLGLQPRLLRPGRVRDLFPSERTTASVLYGMRETGFTNNARVVAERTAADGSAATGGPTDVYGLKPMSQITVVPITYPIATIAHLMTAHRNVLADEPRLRSLIDTDMVDGVKLAEDYEILFGDGQGENLTGILNTPGVQQYTGLAADRKSAQVRRAMTRAILAYHQPTGVVMHPLDWEDLELEQDRNGAYVLAVSIAVGGDKRVWRLNVVDTPVFPEGEFLVGAFGRGAKLYDREEVNVLISTEDSDNFRRNAVTIRAEERVGLEVPRPESFVHGEFTDYVDPTLP